MNLNKVEVQEVERVVSDATESQFNELNDLQLVLVGGGIGETVL